MTTPMQESLESAVRLIRAVDGTGEDQFVFASWLPPLNPESDPFYKRPVAFDTVTTYLLALKLPARILIHGASGNGKTSLLRQIQSALTNQVCRGALASWQGVGQAVSFNITPDVLVLLCVCLALKPVTTCRKRLIGIQERGMVSLNRGDPGPLGLHNIIII